MKLAEIVVTKTGWLAGAAALVLCGSFAFRSAPLVAPVVDIEAPNELAVDVRDTVGDRSCASDVTTQGSRVFVHLREDPKTCAGVVRVYRVEGDRLVFEQELIDI
jgi:hypothetical protein